MRRGTIRGAVLLAALAGLGLVVWTVGAGGEGSGLREGRGGCPGQALGHRMHHVHELIEDLELDDEQQQHVQAIHEALMGSVTKLPAVHEHLLRQSLERLEAGYTDPYEVRQEIDRHLEALRHTAYTVADEWVALGNSLEPDQREILREHLEAALAMSVERKEEKGSWLHRLGRRIHGHGGGHHGGHGGGHSG